MTNCAMHASGAIELYFYDELPAAERLTVEAHLESCRHCRLVLADLGTIRTALAGRPSVSSPPGGDWSGFMARLGESIAHEPSAERGPHRSGRVIGFRSSYAPYLAMAALLALVTFAVTMAWRARTVPQTAESPAIAERPAPAAPADASAFQALSEEHFERSKLVVLGLATKDGQRGAAADWAYERSLASSLLNDTRIYRLAAEERGLTALAGVMRDLELVLLQTALTDARDPASLPQIQRLIKKRDLLEKMDVVTTTGL
jgi:hypothetical protein